MVKKISGTGPSKPAGGPSGVRSTETVQGAKVDSVQKVGQTQAQSGAGKVRRSTRPMTQAERDHLLSLVDEEADKMFGEGKLPESKKKTLTDGVKLTLQASLFPETEEEPNS